jgi:uncharacterized protein YegP (UPF0339 family)
MAAKFEIYKNKSGEFRWRPIYINGRAIANLGESYKAKLNAMDGDSEQNETQKTKEALSC